MSDYRQAVRLTVGDLITQLQQHDPNTLVLVNGYEGGYQAPEVYATHVQLDWSGNCEGPWHDHEDGQPRKDPTHVPRQLPSEPAVIVSRGQHE